MSLPYFNLYPTDFEADTSHLTLAEDGAYNRLMRLCWMAPTCSLPDDDAWIMRRMRVDLATFESVVSVVIAEFFVRKGGRVSNARLSKEFEISNDAHSKRVLAGKKGGAAKSLKPNEKTPSNAKAMLKQPEPEPEPEPKKKEKKDSHAISAKPLGGDGLEFELDGAPPVDPLESCFDFYNSKCEATGWPRVQLMTDTRRKALGARLKAIGGPENWKAQIEQAARSDYLTGRVNGWRASFDWLATAGNFAKVVEGNYHNKGESDDPRFVVNGVSMTKAQRQELLDWAHIARDREIEGIAPDPSNPLTDRWREFITE